MHSLVVHALVLVFICPTAFLLRLLLLRIGGLDESSDDGLKEQLEDRPQGEPSIQSEEVPSDLRSDLRSSPKSSLKTSNPKLFVDGFFRRAKLVARSTGTCGSDTQHSSP